MAAAVVAAALAMAACLGPVEAAKEVFTNHFYVKIQSDHGRETLFMR